jgi:hypothetical protein
MIVAFVGPMGIYPIGVKAITMHNAPIMPAIAILRVFILITSASVPLRDTYLVLNYITGKVYMQ